MLKTSQSGRRTRLTEPVAYIREVFEYTQDAVPEVSEPVVFCKTVEEAGQAIWTFFKLG
jgi:hypothetical protein